MGVVIAPLPACGDPVAVQLGESCRPVSNDSRADERTQERLERVRLRREELRAMVELEGIGASCCHAPADAARFFEYNNVLRVREFSRHDEAERIYQERGLEAFADSERQAANQPLSGGPFKHVLEALHRIQSAFPIDNNPIRTALVTARSAPAHKRVVLTLREWGIRIDEALFLGGMDKSAFLTAFGADFLDHSFKNPDQLENALGMPLLAVIPRLDDK